MCDSMIPHSVTRDRAGVGLALQLLVQLPFTTSCPPSARHRLYRLGAVYISISSGAANAASAAALRRANASARFNHKSARS